MLRGVNKKHYLCRRKPTPDETMMYLTGYNPLTGRREAISFPMEDDAALRKLAQIKKDGSVYKRVTVRRLEPNQLLLDL